MTALSGDVERSRKHRRILRRMKRNKMVQIFDILQKKIEPYFLFDLEPINAFHENMHPQIFLGKKLFSKPLTESMRMISEML